jgi:hypothetical protein
MINQSSPHIKECVTMMVHAAKWGQKIEHELLKYHLQELIRIKNKYEEREICHDCQRKTQ